MRKPRLKFCITSLLSILVVRNAAPKGWTFTFRLRLRNLKRWKSLAPALHNNLINPMLWAGQDAAFYKILPSLTRYLRKNRNVTQIRLRGVSFFHRSAGQG